MPPSATEDTPTIISPPEDENPEDSSAAGGGINAVRSRPQSAFRRGGNAEIEKEKEGVDASIKAAVARLEVDPEGLTNTEEDGYEYEDFEVERAPQALTQSL